jgi:hypothetical protein
MGHREVDTRTAEKPSDIPPVSLHGQFENHKPAHAAAGKQRHSEATPPSRVQPDTRAGAHATPEAPPATVDDKHITFMPFPKDKGSSELWTDSVAIAFYQKFNAEKQTDEYSCLRMLNNPELEGAFTKWTEKVLNKDADIFPTVTNPDGSKTYTVVQIGITNRPIDPTPTSPNNAENLPHYYKRAVDITLHASDAHFSQSDIRFHDRFEIQEDEFKNLLSHERDKLKEPNTPGSNDVDFYTHGTFVGPNKADQESILLQLTNGHPTVDIDWRTTPADPEDSSLVSLYLNYREGQNEAADANLALDASIDTAIAAVGANHAIMIGMSHGSAFDSRYLYHRVSSHLPKLGMVVFAHPDVPISAPELELDDRKWLLSAAAARSFVIGSSADRALQSVARIDNFLQVPDERLGSDSERARQVIESNHSVAISEVPRVPRNSNQHFVNYAGIANILNGDPRRSQAQTQAAYVKATGEGRNHWLSKEQEQFGFVQKLKYEQLIRESAKVPSNDQGDRTPEEPPIREHRTHHRSSSKGSGIGVDDALRALGCIKAGISIADLVATDGFDITAWPGLITASSACYAEIKKLLRD